VVLIAQSEIAITTAAAAAAAMESSHKEENIPLSTTNDRSEFF
jgi:hypothetical protein